MKHIRPTFFIIGERKCGTSSLYRYLLTHPEVLPCKLKEPNFFGQHDEAYIAENIDQYFQLFPTIDFQGDLSFSWPELNKEGILYHEDVKISRAEGIQYISGEASANTFAEVDPRLVKQYVPDIKLILLFRNPVDRAYSHHRMYQRFQEEGRDLGFKVNDFETDVEKEIKAINRGAQGDYLYPGLYLQRLQAWVRVFGQENIQIFISEELNTKAGARQIMNEIGTFLGIRAHDYGEVLSHRFNQAPPSAIQPHLRQKLLAFFRKPNQQLADYLGRELPWDS